ncbi:hypothetical protein P3T18_002021 [Paraburkholderia sp. GAS199]
MDRRDAEAPGAHAPGVATPLRGRTPLETGSQMLLRHCLPAAYLTQASASRHCWRVSGQDFPAPFRPVAQCTLIGQFVVILQWGRIVTESQSATATGENPASTRRYPENITRARPKSDGRARFNTAGFSRAFHTHDFSVSFRRLQIIFQQTIQSAQLTTSGDLRVSAGRVPRPAARLERPFRRGRRPDRR